MKDVDNEFTCFLRLSFLVFFCMQLFTVCHSSLIADCKKGRCHVCYHEGTISSMGWNKTTRFFYSIWLFCDTVHNSKDKADKVKAEEVRMKAMERLFQTKKRASEEAEEG